MDNLRTILFALLAVVLFLLYQAWQEDYGPGSAGGGAPETVQQQSSTPDIPAADPSSAVPSPAAPTPGEIPASQPASSEGAYTSRIVRVRPRPVSLTSREIQPAASKCFTYRQALDRTVPSLSPISSNVGPCPCRSPRP